MANDEDYVATENLVSSDEYSDVDDDMQDLRSADLAAVAHIQARFADAKEKKKQQIKLLMKRKKFTQLYVTKSLKCLWNKPKREIARYQRAMKRIKKGNGENAANDEMDENEMDPEKGGIIGKSIITTSMSPDRSAPKNTAIKGNTWDDLENQEISPTKLSMDASLPKKTLTVCDGGAINIESEKVDDAIEILSDVEFQDGDEHIQAPAIQEKPYQQLPFLEQHVVQQQKPQQDSQSLQQQYELQQQDPQSLQQQYGPQQQEPQPLRQQYELQQPEPQLLQQQHEPQQQEQKPIQQKLLLEQQEQQQPQHNAALNMNKINLLAPSTAEEAFQSAQAQAQVNMISMPDIHRIFEALQAQTNNVNGAQSSHSNIISNLLKSVKHTFKNQPTVAEDVTQNIQNNVASQPEEAPQQMEMDDNNEVSRKRARSISPDVSYSVVENNDNQRAKIERIEKTDFEDMATQTDEPPAPLSLFEKVKKTMAEHNAMINDEIKEHTTYQKIEDHIFKLAADIDYLNGVLAEKEFEWDKILHFKKLKEEILGRLMRKKVIFERDQMNEDKIKDAATMVELRDLESYLLGDQPQKHQTLVEEILAKNVRALKETPNYLQRLLQSHNSALNKNTDLPARPAATTTRGNSLEEFAQISELNEIDKIAKQNLQREQMQYLENKNQTSNLGMGRQGQTVEVKSLIADFRQSHPDTGVRAGKRMRINEPVKNLNRNQYMNDVGQVSFEATNNVVGHASHTSQLEKLLSRTRDNDSYSVSHPLPYTPHSPSASSTLATAQMLSSQEFQLNHAENNSYNRSRNNRMRSLNEVTITPINNHNRYYQKGEHAKLRTALHANSHNLQSSGAVYVGGNGPFGNDWKSMEANNTLYGSKGTKLCQGCKSKEAQFICAGCGNERYCSRVCQENAWDEHSLVCTD